MERNLERRVEVLTRIRSKRIKNYLKVHILEIMLKDNQQATELQTNGKYLPVSHPKKTPLSTHQYLLNWHTSRRE